MSLKGLNVVTNKSPFVIHEKMHSTDICNEIHRGNPWRNKKMQKKKKIASGQLHISNPWWGGYMPKPAESIHGFTVTSRNEHTFFLKDVLSQAHCL